VWGETTKLRILGGVGYGLGIVDFSTFRSVWANIALSRIYDKATDMSRIGAKKQKKEEDK
jgi:hypothetical protein